MSATESSSKIRIKVFDGGKVPEYKHDDDACADCYARLAGSEITIPNGGRCLVALGFAIELPRGWEAVIRPRSGLSKRGIDNTIGTIDAGYRGEVMVCVVNNSGGDYTIYNHDRICQLKIQEARQFKFVPVEELSETDRGSGGFGSTGMKG